ISGRNAIGTESFDVFTEIVLPGLRPAIVMPSTCISAGPDASSSCISIASVELTTTDRLVRACGQIGVTVSTLHSGLMIGPPAASEYAVEPVGVAIIRPSHR